MELSKSKTHLKTTTLASNHFISLIWQLKNISISHFRYPLELHLVHSKKSLNSNPMQCEHNGEYCGLSVVGILFHVGSEDNAAFAVGQFLFYFFITEKLSYSDQDPHM